MKRGTFPAREYPKEYSAWSGMRRRCIDETRIHYHGRGIKVCDRWQTFEQFYRDMGPKPTLAHTLDRIDSAGNYEPGNCRWATRQTQNANRTNIRPLKFNGKSLLLTEWSKELGMSVTSLWSRIYRRGWSVERALTTPLKRLA